MRFSRWKDKLGRLAKLKPSERWLTLRAVYWLAVGRLMIVVMPFRRLASKLSRQAAEGEAEGTDAELLIQVGRAVSRAANNVPWRSDCFPQTIAARMLLKSYGINSVIRIGVERRGGDELAGHAWLTCGEVVVTGGTELDRYTELHRLQP